MTDTHYSQFISPTEEIIEEARNGRMFILVDHEDRENEGDLIIPGQMATPDAVNFMATHGKGLICLAMTAERLDDLGLDLMSTNNLSAPRNGLYCFNRSQGRCDHRHFCARPRPYSRGCD